MRLVWAMKSLTSVLATSRASARLVLSTVTLTMVVLGWGVTLIWLLRSSTVTRRRRSLATFRRIGRSVISCAYVLEIWSAESTTVGLAVASGCAGLTRTDAQAS